MMKSSITFAAFFLCTCLVAVTLQVYFFTPLSSLQPLHLHSSTLFDSLFPPNALLQKLTKIGEGSLIKPESACVDKEGILYTVGRDGWIKRMQTKNEMSTLEDWKWINSSDLLGTTITAAGDLIVCDAQQGLFKVNEDGITLLVSHFNGSKLRLADDVIEADDGSLYFSVGSTKFDLHEWHHDWFEANPYGQLLKYDPQTKETSLILDNIHFANGVAISSDKDYLVVCESWRYRCIKYWLKGDLKGSTEIFIQNLAGAPDNINLAPDGSFWIALIQLREENMGFAYTSKILRHLVATFPSLKNIIQVTQKKARVIKVASNGTILRRLDDPNGKVIAFVTSALEYEGNLYLGSLTSNFLGKLPLQEST